MNVLSRLKQVATISTVAVCISVATISQATAAERYIVSGVESWDTLNIRSQPSARSAIIGEIPADGQNINSNGETRGNGRTTWLRVTYNGVSGWVSKRYLATDYTFNGAATSTAATSATDYTPQPMDTSATTTVRTGSIYDAGSATTARSVYVGPGNGLPAITTKRQTQYIQQPVAVAPVRVANTGNTHSHPANRCTRSIAHNHAGPAGHSHRYSCQGQATQQPQRQAVAVRQVVVDNNSHTHPRNQYSNAVTHSHASNNRQHSHNYGRQVQQQRVQVRAVATGNSHTHPRNQYSNAVTHNHASNNANHSHNYGRQVQQQRVQVRAVATGNSHTHPRNQFTNAVTHNHASNDANHRHNYGQNGAARQGQTQQVAVRAGSNQVTHIHPESPYNARTTHTHPGGAGIHVHDFLLPPAQRSGATQQTVQTRDVNAHTHPKNQFTNSVTHTHANGVNNHSHSYGAR